MHFDILDERSPVAVSMYVALFIWILLTVAIAVEPWWSIKEEALGAQQEGTDRNVGLDEIKVCSFIYHRCLLVWGKFEPNLHIDVDFPYF